MQCVILAGGLGTRIRYRSGDLPKALIPVLGKPFIFYQLEWLAQQQVRRVVVSVSYRGDMIADAVGDGSRFGVSVICAHEGNDPRGTAGALRFLADRGLLDAGFFVLYGDSYLPIELAPVWNFSKNGTCCTMTVMKNRGQWDKSNVLYRDGRLILYDKEACEQMASEMHYIDYGISVLTQSTVEQAVAPHQIADLAPILRRLSVQGLLQGYEVFERFYEIGTPEGLDDFTAYVANREQVLLSGSDRAS